MNVMERTDLAETRRFPTMPGAKRPMSSIGRSGSGRQIRRRELLRILNDAQSPRQDLQHGE